MTPVATSHGSVARDRPAWRAVAIPTEHGGWGREHIAAVKVIGLRQMSIGLTIVAAPATGALM